MIAPIHAMEPQTPPALALAYAGAQTKLRQSRAAGFCDQYLPLMQLMEQGRRWGGLYAVAALEACQEIAAADEPTLARMVALKRPCPTKPNGNEITTARQAATEQTNRAIAEATAMATRPRVTLAEQLAAMERRGIRISVQGRHLKVHAPDGVLTEPDRALLREHKAEIIGWLDTNAETF